ncbi:MAG: hypothetical protein DRR19_31830, partial [Candidatus Parabeggiatoa sp. nov. 1]
MQNNLRRFFLTGAISLGLLIAAGTIFLSTDNVAAETKLDVAKGIAHYHNKDYVEAAQWFRKAAEQGDSQAQYLL